MSYPFDYDDNKISSSKNSDEIAQQTKEGFGMDDFPQKYFNDYTMEPADPKENTIQYIKNAIGQNETEITEVAKLFFSEKNILSRISEPNIGKLNWYFRIQRDFFSKSG